MTVPAPQLPPPLSSGEAAAFAVCQRCRTPGIAPIRIRRAHLGEHTWTRLLVCADCIALAESDDRYTVLRGVGDPA